MKDGPLSSLRSWVVFFLQLRLRNLELGVPGLTAPTLLQCPLQNVSESAEASSRSGQAALA